MCFYCHYLGKNSNTDKHTTQDCSDPNNRDSKYHKEKKCHKCFTLDWNRYAKHHTNEECKEKKSLQNETCKECHILITLDTHCRLHEMECNYCFGHCPYKKMDLIS